MAPKKKVTAKKQVISKGDSFELSRNRGKDDSDDGPYFIPRMPKGPTHRGYIPARLWCIVSLMLRVFKPMRPFSVADCFAGKCAISKAFIRNNMRAAALDFELDQRDDILDDMGFLRWLWCILNVKRGGLMAAGILCSSWSIVNRGTSGRTEQAPLGREHFPSVSRGNLMVSRMALILYLCIYRGIHWLVENPEQSLIWFHPRLRELLMYHEIFECKTYLGMFGAKTWKPVLLVSSDPCVQQLARRLDRSKFEPSDSTVVYWDSQGRKRFKGAGGKLKRTQVYPPSFGREVCRLYTTTAAAPTWPSHVDYTNDPWEDAKLGDVERFLVDYLNARHARRKRQHGD